MLQERKMKESIAACSPHSPLIDTIAKIMSATSNPDSLKIFFYAADVGISSSTKVIKELGFTQKRYYTRLNELLDAGLLQKHEDGTYQVTALGRIRFKLCEFLAESLNHSDHLELIDKVQNSPKISFEEKERIIDALSQDNLSIYSNFLDGNPHPTGIVTKFEDLKVLVIKLIESSEQKLYMASRYTDLSVVECVLKRLNKGLEMHFIDGDRENLSTRTQLLRLVLSNPLKLKKFYDMFRSPNVHVKFCDLPFSFLVSDERNVCIELVNPNDNEFLGAFLMDNKMLAKKFMEFFDSLYNEAKEDPLKAFASDLSKKI